MIDLRTGDTPTIKIEILDGGDQDTVRFKLAGILDPQDPYEMPRQALQRHIQRAQELQVELDALAREEAGNDPF
ncbi:TPA: hypothetical protein ACSP2Z_003587 [Aeromonas hydrophila]